MSEEAFLCDPGYSRLLRNEMRVKRAAIPRLEREKAGRRAWQILRHWPVLRRSQRVAVYIAMPGEFPTQQIIAGLHRQGKEIYLPVIHFSGEREMVFRRYRPGDRLLLNRYGIPEPLGSHRDDMPAHRLDLVLVPLLGFDHRGSRLGMGGGYYDTHFAFRLAHWRMRKPWLLGLAYEIQRCKNIQRHSWDVPLDGVLTGRRLMLFSPNFSPA